MTDAVDTSAEAVERLASRVNTVADWRCYGIAATLRALLAERDTWQQMAMDAAHRLMIAETERDAALAAVREALREPTHEMREAADQEAGAFGAAAGPRIYAAMFTKSALGGGHE